MKDRKLKDHYYQLSENIFDKREIKKLILEFGDSGFIWWLKIELDLVKNDGIGEKNWKWYSSDDKDKKVIEYIINEMMIDNENNTFSSDEVNSQLKVRKEISIKRTESVKSRWNKNKKENIPEQDIPIVYIVSKERLHGELINGKETN